MGHQGSPSIFYISLYIKVYVYFKGLLRITNATVVAEKYFTCVRYFSIVLKNIYYRQLLTYTLNKKSLIELNKKCNSCSTQYVPTEQKFKWQLEVSIKVKFHMQHGKMLTWKMVLSQKTYKYSMLIVCVLLYLSRSKETIIKGLEDWF